jgi:hypothetical protein
MQSFTGLFFNQFYTNTMRRILLFIIILFSALAVRANPVAEYYELVNEAELLICKERFQYALQHYDKAFALKGMQPWGKDVYDAWVCAFKLGDKKRFSRYSILLLQKDAFAPEGPEPLLYKIDSTAAPAFIAIWRQLKKVTRITIDADYHARLDRFLRDDQRLRKYCIGLYQGEYNIGGRDTLNIFDSLHTLKMRDFFITEGFPTEARAGFWNNNPIASTVYDIVLLHDRSWTNRQTLDSLLYTEIFTGRYHPYEYAILKDYSYQSSFTDSISEYQHNTLSRYGTNVFSVLDNNLYTDKVTPSRIVDINTTRKSIYLDLINDMYVKGNYQFKHNHFYLLPYGSLFAHFTGLPDDIKEKIKKHAYREEEMKDFNTIETRICRHGLKHR